MKTILATALAVLGGAMAAAQQPAAPVSEYIYTPPAGWTTSPATDATLLEFTVPTNGEKCLIGLGRIVPSSGDLVADLNQAWARYFNELEARRTMTFFAEPHVVRGVAAQGWEYLLVKRGVGQKGSPVDPVNGQQFFGFVMVARLGTRVAPIFGVSLDPLVSSCFGTSLGNVWPRFFASLQFRGFRAANASAFQQKIVGAWESYGSSIGGGASLGYVFTQAGRYAESQAMVRDLTDISVLASAAFGNGRYAVQGNELTLMPDRGTREVAFIRLEQVSEDGGRSWVEKLYMLKPLAFTGHCGQFRCVAADPEFQMTRRR